MKTETILFAVKKGAPDWCVEIITTKKERIPAAKKWARQMGNSIPATGQKGLNHDHNTKTNQEIILGDLPGITAPESR